MSRWLFLFTQWLKRDLDGRYRGAWLGWLWPLAQPLAQLAVFTLIFHGFMQVRWPTPMSQGIAGAVTDGGGAWTYALNVFAGLAVFNFFAEILGRSPAAVMSQPNLVTKVRFPLPVLPAVTVGAALVHIGVGTAVLTIAGWWQGTLTVQWLWLPVWLLPVMMYGVAAAMLLSSLGVFVRDISQAVPAVTSLLMFLTPIFYPMSAVPPSLRGLFQANPVAWAADALRGLLLEGRGLAIVEWGVHLLIAMSVAGAAIAIFLKLEKGFADVL